MVIAIIFGLLALFSLISFKLATDDGGHRGSGHGQDDSAMFLMRFGHH